MSRTTHTILETSNKLNTAYRRNIQNSTGLTLYKKTFAFEDTSSYLSITSLQERTRYIETNPPMVSDPLKIQRPFLTDTLTGENYIFDQVKTAGLLQAQIVSLLDQLSNPIYAQQITPSRNRRGHNVSYDDGTFLAGVVELTLINKDSSYHDDDCFISFSQHSIFEEFL